MININVEKQIENFFKKLNIIISNLDIKINNNIISFSFFINDTKFDISIWKQFSDKNFYCVKTGNYILWIYWINPSKEHYKVLYLFCKYITNSFSSFEEIINQQKENELIGDIVLFINSINLNNIVLNNPGFLIYIFLKKIKFKTDHFFWRVDHVLKTIDIVFKENTINNYKHKLWTDELLFFKNNNNALEIYKKIIKKWNQSIDIEYCDNKEIYNKENLYNINNLSFSIHPSLLVKEWKIKSLNYLDWLLSNSRNKNIFNENNIKLFLEFDLSLNTYKKYNEILLIKEEINKYNYLNHKLDLYLDVKLREIKIINKIQNLLKILWYKNINDVLDCKRNINIFSFENSINFWIDKNYLWVAYKVYNKETTDNFPSGWILICNRLDSLYIRAIYKSDFIITEDSSLFIHTAIICKELKKKVIFWAKWIFFNINNGQNIKINLSDKNITIF